MASGGQGHLLLLLDTSASLKASDPDAQRVAAAQYLVSELADFVAQSGAKLDVAISGFADKFRVSRGWTDLDAKSAGGIRQSINQYRDKNGGFETDYWLAITGARKYLAKQAKPGDCTALVWLSDGAYDLDQRDTDAEQKKYGTTKPYGPHVKLVNQGAARNLEHAGASDLCRDGGVADAVRVDGITTLAIGLQGNQDAGDFSLMKGIATSSKVGGSACGARDGNQLGAFVLAGDVASLFFAFDKIVDPDHAPISTETKFCQGSICSEYDHRFVLDPSISSVRILGGSELKKYFAVLISPSGKQVRIVPGRPISADLAAFSVAGTWRADSVFSLAVKRKTDNGWTGAWRLVFVDPDSTDRGLARTNIRLYGDVGPAWTNSDAPLVVGETAKFKFGLKRKDGTVIAPTSIAGNVAVDAQLEFSDGTTVPIAESMTAADLADPVATDLSSAPSGDAKVHVTLSLTTAAAGSAPGTTLEPQAIDYPVTVKPPPSYPKVDSTVDFGSGDTKDSTRASLKVRSAGCVWLASAETLTLPDGIAHATVTSKADAESNCASGNLALTLTPNDVGSGLVSGTLQVMTKPANGGNPVPVTVRYRYEMERPADDAVRWAVFAGLLALGLLIPLLLLLVAKWMTAKIPGSALSWLTVSGSVSHGSSFLNQEILDLSAIRSKSLTDADRRSITLTSRVTLRAKANLRRLASPGHIVIEGGPVVTSTGNTLPLAVQDHWLAVLDPSNPAGGTVEVTFLLAPGAAKLSELLSDARANLPSLVERLRQKLAGSPRAASGRNSERGGSPDPAAPLSGGSDDSF